jgi:hypothetical protein
MRKMVTVTAGIPTDWQTRLGTYYIIIELKLSIINQVYYSRLFCQNTETLQLFTINFLSEIIYKRY